MQRMVELRQGTYHLIQELGHGASSTVYLASAISGPYQNEIQTIRTGTSNDPTDPIEENNPRHRPFPIDLIQEFGQFEGEGEFLRQGNVECFPRDAFLIPEGVEPSMQSRRSRTSEIEALSSIFAIKVVIVESDQPQQRKKYQEFIQQLKILQQLNHPGIVKVEDYSNLSPPQQPFPKKLYMATEYGSCGNLLKLIDKVEDMDRYRQERANIFAYYAAQMVNIIDYLQSSGISHRDIKAENFILDARYRLKLIDFGLAEASDASKIVLEDDQPTGSEKGYIGSKHYISPEMIERSRRMGTKQQYFKTDLWSLGILLYFMWTGTYPFEGSNTFYVLEAIKKNQPDYSRLPKDPRLRILIRSLLQKKTEERWGIQQVKGCQYFRSLNLAKIYEMESPIISILSKEEEDHVFREEVTVRIEEEAKRRFVGLIRKKSVKEDYGIEVKKVESNLNIKKNISENTEINSEKKIGSQSSLESPPQLKRYLTIAKIRSRMMPKQMELQENTRYQVKERENKIVIIFGQDNEAYPSEVQIQFQQEDHLSRFIQAYRRLFE